MRAATITVMFEVSLLLAAIIKDRQDEDVELSYQYCGGKKSTAVHSVENRPCLKRGLILHGLKNWSCGFWLVHV